MNALVQIRDGEPRANSVDVAAAFEKAHKDVLRAIDKLIELAPEIDRRNFAPISVKDRYGRGQRGYDMDRDGFSLLAMGFTGPKALQWKLKFIAAFNEMEAALRDSLAANDDEEEPIELPPSLRTADQRDAVRTAVSVVRLVRELKGPLAAWEMWRRLQMPFSMEMDGLELPAPLPVPEAEVGPLWKWTSECAVKPNLGVAHPLITLWQEYVAWCGRKGFRYAEPPVFGQGLRNVFGKEERKGIFNLEVGKTSILVGIEQRPG